MTQKFLNFGLSVILICSLATSALSQVVCTDIFAFDTLYMQKSICTDAAKVCLDVPFADRNNYNIYINDTIYNSSFFPCNFDTLITYNYDVLVGIDDPASNYRVTSWMINGSPITFTFNTLSELVDSMNVADPNSNWSSNVALKVLEGGNPTNTYSTMSVLELNTSSMIQMNTNMQFVPSGTEISVVLDESWVVLEDTSTMCRDSFQLLVSCIQSTTIVDTMFINDIDTICLETIELRSGIASISNTCSSSSGSSLLFDIVNASTCIEITGVDIGNEQACYVLMDSVGLTDTFYLDYTVIMPPSDDVKAVPDTTFTNINTPLVVNALANDTLITPADSIYIISQTQNGTVTANNDLTFTYTPNLDFRSDDPDCFQYGVCSMGICDSTSACIFVRAIDPNALVVRNGMSPNNDGINDFFTIEGIESFPDNQVCVFNRWGIRVFAMEGYTNANAWDGKWDGYDLPDGTYFWSIDNGLNNNIDPETGEQILQTGWLQISR